jgi:hypothetical protein
MSLVRRPIRLLLSLTSAAIAAFLLLPVAAGQADVLAQSDCTPSSSASQAFLPWGDQAYYELVPGGDFEGSLADWTLAGGAAQVTGSEPFGVTGSVGSQSLALPDGAAAVSPPACVDAADPTVELFSQSQDPGTTVSVSAVFQRKDGKTMTVPVGTVTPGSTWQPSGPLTIDTPHAKQNGNLLVALELSATGGTAQVDDVFIDPWYRH